MRIGPKYKISRRLGEAVFSKTQTPRYAMVEGKKKQNLQKRRKHRSNLTEYGIQLLEKQKLRYTYGVSERQLSNYISKAKGKRGESPAAIVYKMLENRLDNVVYRLGLTPTRQFARQVVTHGHITVNSKRVNVPSYQVRKGDKISIRESSRGNSIFKEKAKALAEFASPAWLRMEPQGLVAEITGEPKMGAQEAHLNFAMVVQFYSRV